ncbi:ATP-binding protein [Pseudogemmobacter faecipullorum]|uniref:histidine kinase n=1 Tax=Pseudogemmobacter faecipullorum TaxID=2755041 RepID=A0ABS8CIE4_9RHOB|nr:ATP-binding protein [Pseudogemmobacter faecipullorum]MCB5409148.1 HAMP domain-containing protein [Pseudogemmobacter faecipullorum]
MPDSIAGRFALLLIGALLSSNLILASMLGRAGTAFDMAIRIERDLPRLTSLVKALELGDREAGLTLLGRWSTRYTHFSVDKEPLGRSQSRGDEALAAQVREILPYNPVQITTGGLVSAGEEGGAAMLGLSVQLGYGPRASEWLNLRVLPLPATRAWPQKWAFFLPFLASLVAVLIAGLWFLRQITRPLRQMTLAATAVGAGDHRLRLPESGPGELRQMAGAFNEMQRQISRFEADRQQMLASIGHDLRTPITSLRLRTELLGDDQQREPMIRTLDEMAVMAADITLFARDMQMAEPVQSIDLAALLGQICSERGLDFHAAEALHLKLRPVALRRAVSNLIDNAQRYAGHAEISLEASEGGAVIRVCDSGPGIPPGELAGITEPFRRGEASRNRQTGGYGLGLSIAGHIAGAHGGELRLSNRQPRGLCAELRLPLL